MTDKKMKKIMKRDKHRKIAQGIGATGGVIATLTILAAFFPDALGGVGEKLKK